MTFEQFIEQSEDYINLRFQYGNQLFVQEQGKYKIQAVRLAFEVWEAVERLKKAYINETVSSMEQTILLDQKDKEIDKLKAELAQYEKLVTSLRNQFDLWADGSDFADIIEAQIENLEGLNIK